MINNNRLLYHYTYVNMVVPIFDGVYIVVYGMVVLRYYIISIMKPLPFLPQRTKLPTLESDLLKLTALIRERESTLVMLL